MYKTHNIELYLDKEQLPILKEITKKLISKSKYKRVKNVMFRKSFNCIEVTIKYRNDTPFWTWLCCIVLFPIGVLVPVFVPNLIDDGTSLVYDLEEELIQLHSTSLTK